MNFLRKAELLNLIVQEIAYAAPNNWSKVVYYTERVRDEVIGLRNKDTAKCWIGIEMKPYDNSKGPPLKCYMELFDVVDTLFEESESTDDSWRGLCVTVDQTGKYKSKFYYEGTPLLDGNDGELAKRFVDLAL